MLLEKAIICDVATQNLNQQMVYMMERADWNKLKEILTIDWETCLGSDDV